MMHLSESTERPPHFTAAQLVWLAHTLVKDWRPEADPSVYWTTEEKRADAMIRAGVRRLTVDFLLEALRRQPGLGPEVRRLVPALQLWDS